MGNSPWAYIREELLSGGYLCLRFGGLIFGRAFFLGGGWGVGGLIIRILRYLTQAAVPIMYHQITAKSPGSEVIYTTSSICHISHDNSITPCESKHSIQRWNVKYNAVAFLRHPSGSCRILHGLVSCYRIAKDPTGSCIGNHEGSYRILIRSYCMGSYLAIGS